MRVLICPDKFAGTLSALDAAAAIGAGWQAVAASDEVICRPLADGGPGFLDVLHERLAGTLVPVPACDPLGRPVTAQVLVTGEPGAPDRVAYLESAQVCGLHLLAGSERNPTTTTSYGLGLLLIAAAELGVARIVVGLGGSATNDAGAGLLAALDAAPLDAGGFALPYGGGALLGCRALGGVPRLRPVRLVAATDVDNPLTGPQGASTVYGPQKGAGPDDVALLDAALAQFATVLERDVPGCPPGLAGLPGSGAAGGLGAALLALGGQITSGIGLVHELTGLAAALDRADLVITGEGSFDGQSLRGKLVSGVAGAARARGVPCVVLAGRVAADPAAASAAGVTGAYSLVDHFGSTELAMTRPAEGLRELAGMLAGRWPVSG